MSLLLTLGPLGALGSNRILDDRTSTSDEFKFESLEGGYSWMSRIKTYLISRVPAISRILYWAEREESIISPERLHEAVGQGLRIYNRDSYGTDHTESRNSAVGFPRQLHRL